MQTKSKATRSPILEPSLPQAGESLTFSAWERFSDLVGLLFAPLAVFSIAVMEWIHYVFRTPPQPWIPTIGLVVVIALAWRKGRRIWSEMERISLGIKGERVVGQLLETLRVHGYRVFHDIEEEGYNIDHTVIGPGGVFVIETKAPES